MTKEKLNQLAKEVPGIEVQSVAPAGAKVIAGPFYPDESEVLKDTLRNIRDRKAVTVAPNADGWLTIYRKS